MQRVLGAYFSQKTSELLSERKSFRSSRLPNHCTCHTFLWRVKGNAFSRHATSARCKFSQKTAEFVTERESFHSSRLLNHSLRQLGYCILPFCHTFSEASGGCEFSCHRATARYNSSQVSAEFLPERKSFHNLRQLGCCILPYFSAASGGCEFSCHRATARYNFSQVSAEFLPERESFHNLQQLGYCILLHFSTCHTTTARCIFHKFLQSFCPSGRVSTASGSWAIAFSKTLAR